MSDQAHRLRVALTQMGHDLGLADTALSGPAPVEVPLFEEVPA